MKKNFLEKVICRGLILCLGIQLIGTSVQAQASSKTLIEKELLDLENPKWKMDTDNDGITDAEEEIMGLNPKMNDSDLDGLIDKYELEIGLNPLSKDSDGNGILDGYEDLDQDGLTTLEEQNYGTSPIVKDTDGDGLSDYDEINTYKTNPLEEDTDNDGVKDNIEIELGTNPNKKDSNDNGINDGDESYYKEIKIREYDKDKNIDVSIYGDIKGRLIDSIKISNMEGSRYSVNENILYAGIGKHFRVGLYKEGEKQDVTLKFKTNNDNHNLELFIYNEHTKRLEKVQGIINDFNNEITINVTLSYGYKDYVLLSDNDEVFTSKAADLNDKYTKVDNNLLVKFADLSYEKLKEEHIDKKVSEIEAEDLGNDKYIDKISREDMDTWTVIDVNNGKGVLGGFGAVAVKKERDLIVSFAGTGIANLDLPDFVADITIVTNSNYQTVLAKDFMKRVLNKCQGDIDNVYISGHSLGGYLTQYTIYQCIENTFSNSSLLKNINCSSVTFNAPNFLTPAGVKGILESSCILGSIISIPDIFKNIFFEDGKYKDYNVNYIIDGDKVSKVGRFYLGRRVRLENSLKYDEKDSPHSLYHFYKQDLNKMI